jgi:hypothetical protein
MFNFRKYKFLGCRITRGQYNSANKTIINADVNGALNILRKAISQGKITSKLIVSKITSLQNSGCLAQPLRIRIA